MKFVSHRRGRTSVPASIATRSATYLHNRGRSGALALGLAAAAAVAVPASASAAASNGPSPVVGRRGSYLLSAYRSSAAWRAPEPAAAAGCRT